MYRALQPEPFLITRLLQVQHMTRSIVAVLGRDAMFKSFFAWLLKPFGSNRSFIL